MNFNSARFDERKDGLESYITASSGPYTVMWNMEDILRKNKLVSSQLKKLADDLISNEFIYNTDNVLAATKRNLVIQGTKGSLTRKGKKK